EPYRRATLADIPPIQMNRVPPLLCELDPRIPLELAQVVQRASAKNAEDRFATMRDFVAALRGCLESFCREAPSTRMRASYRDLSQQGVGGSAEPPASQRATPRHGLIWDGAGSVVPTPTRVELLEVTAAITGAAAARERKPSVARRALAYVRSRWSSRSGIIAACLFGAALGSLGALRHFEAGRGAAIPARAEPESAAASRGMAASLSAARPVAAPEVIRALAAPPESQPSAAVADVSSVVTAPTPPAPAIRQPPPATRARTTSAAASDKSVEAITDVSQAIEVELGTKRSIASASHAEVPRKKLNGGKLIYGD
ncbi:MAG TPA: hypothetical protein VGJ91_07580, partial [Polyangiaceae bacterium]